MHVYACNCIRLFSTTQKTGSLKLPFWCPHINIIISGPDAHMSQNSRFVCPNCGKDYKVLGSLRRHLRYECGQRAQFKCTLCSHSFKRVENLKSHLLNTKKHNVQRTDVHMLIDRRYYSYMFSEACFVVVLLATYNFNNLSCMFAVTKLYLLVVFISDFEHVETLCKHILCWSTFVCCSFALQTE